MIFRRGADGYIKMCSAVKAPSSRRFWSKKALERIGYLDEAVVAYQEWDTAIRLAQYCHFGFEPKPTFIYDYSCQDSISRNSIQAGRGYEYIVHKHIKDILRYLGTGDSPIIMMSQPSGTMTAEIKKTLAAAPCWRLFLNA